MTLRSRSMGALLALGLAIAACGGSAEPEDRFNLKTPDTTAKVAPEPQRTPVTDAEKRVIRGWSDELRGGNVAAAAKYFSVPTQVSISEADELDSARQVEDFNDSFPCGARLISLERTVDQLVLADFELTDRPGGKCDSVGTRARFAFLIDGEDHISRLIMVRDGAGSEPSSA